MFAHGRKNDVRLEVVRDWAQLQAVAKLPVLAMLDLECLQVIELQQSARRQTQRRRRRTQRDDVGARTAGGRGVARLDQQVVKRQMPQVIGRRTIGNSSHASISLLRSKLPYRAGLQDLES